MNFDKSKVYTTFNADEVKIGSKGYFADSKEDLITRAQFETKAYYYKLDKINSYISDYVFMTNGCIYRYFYLVEEPKEKKKRPCTREELIEMLKKQGLPMLRSKDNDNCFTITFFGENVATLSYDCTYEELCVQYTLLDGTELWVNDVPPECISPTPDEIGG